MEDLRTSEAWRVFRIQAELIDGIETLCGLGPAVSVFGSSRLPQDSPHCVAATELAAKLAHNGIDGEFLGNELQPDLIILDLGLPGKSGLEVLRSWRAAGNRTPVLILTARDAWHERVDGLKAGADDYLGKPFHTAELLARLEAIGRRHQGQASNELHWRGVTLNTDNQQATTADGRTLPLTGIEFRLLRYLMQHPQQVHSKTRLSEHVYEEDQQRDSNVLEVYVRRLR